MKRIKQVLISVVFLGFTASIFANVDSDLHSFFNGLGYESNTTSPGAFQGQAAGYYTGGSLFLRNQVKDYQIISVQLPQLFRWVFGY